MPEYKIKCEPKKGKETQLDGNHQGSVCDPQNGACKNKQIPNSLDKNNKFKCCTEKLNIALNKEPFCLNEDCVKLKPSNKDDKEKKVEFFCLNYLLVCTDKSKMTDDSKDVNNKDSDC